MNDPVNKIVRIGRACIVLLILFAGCSHEPKPAALVSDKGPFDELRSAFRSQIKDHDRAAQGVDLVDQLERLMTEANSDLKAHGARIRSLNANYDATEEDFRAEFHEFNSKLSEREERILEINERAKTLTTAEEWKALTKVYEEIMKKALDAEHWM